MLLRLLPAALLGLAAILPARPGPPGAGPAQRAASGCGLVQVPEQRQEPAEGPEAVQPAPPEGYLEPREILARLRALSAEGRCVLENLARTPEGRQVQVAAFRGPPAPGRPAVLVIADPDGDQPVASQVALALCEHLAAGESPLLEAADVFVVAVANPDAASRAFAGEDPWRGAPVDEDRDGRADEDPPDDLDGDHRALWMRVPDPAGEWREGREDARAMVKADPAAGEAGGWRLLREGLDDDGDRRLNEDGRGGVRFDANWPHRWKQHAPESGTFQLSEPETRGLARFVLDHPEIAVAAVFGHEENLARPEEGVEQSGPDSTTPLKEDAGLLKIWGKRLYEGIPARPAGRGPGRGSLAQWAYFQAGLPVLASALWSPPAGEDEAGAKPGGKEKNREGAGRTDEEELIAWNDRVLGGAGFTSWSAFDHPSLGPVEIGGWLPLVKENPPAVELPEISRRWAGFLDSLAADLGRLEWDGVEVTGRGAGVFEARATLVNRGRLATASAMGALTRRPLPLRITLELPEGSAILAGRSVQQVDRLAGLGGHQEFRWVYRLPEGAPPARIMARSQTAGAPEAVLEAGG